MTEYSFMALTKNNKDFVALNEYCMIIEKNFVV